MDMSALMLLIFFFNDTATTEIYTLSLHDALPISARARAAGERRDPRLARSRQAAGATPALTDADALLAHTRRPVDRKSTRLNSSHANISYAVFCLKKKKITILFTLPR